jgi:uroporphyrinogen-III synthase
VSGRFGAEEAFAVGRKAEPPVFLIARCDEADGPLADALTARGARVLRLPLLIHEPGPDLPKLLAWLAEAPDGAALAWTSRRAAELLAARALPKHEARLRSLRLFALGPDSAAPAVAAGLSVEIPEDSLDARRLAAHMGALGGIRKVAVLLGDRSLPDLREGLSAAGLEVETFEVYRTRFAEPDVAEVRRALAGSRLLAAAFSSPSGAEALERLLPPPDVERLHHDVVAVAKGGTTFRALRERGYHRPVDPGAQGLSFEACALDVLDSLIRTQSA